MARLSTLFKGREAANGKWRTFNAEELQVGEPICLFYL